MKIAICGLWHQGIVAAGCLAKQNYQVVGVDLDEDAISTLSSGKSPIFEPGLDDLLGDTIASGKLTFQTDFVGAVEDADVVLITFDTPVDENDLSDLSVVFDCVELIAPALSSSATLLVTAQVPIGTCDELIKRINAKKPTWPGYIAYIPENLRLGQAIERFECPPLPVIGTDSDQAYNTLLELFEPYGQEWRRVSLRTGEMVKHALNGFLAVSICYANEIGRLCDEMGADGTDVAKVLRLEPRIGAKAMLMPGLGFSGGTLARDIQTLRHLGIDQGLKTELLDGAWESNSQQNGLVLRKLKKQFGNVSGRKIAVLGLTYKENTSTLRRSAALEVIADLKAEGALVSTHDPQAPADEVAAIIGETPNADVFGAIKDTDALVLMTPWSDYKSIDFGEVQKSMNGTYVLDTAGLWSADNVYSAGLQYDDIGRGRQAAALS